MAAHTERFGIVRVHVDDGVRECCVKLGTRPVIEPECQCSSTRPVTRRMVGRETPPRPRTPGDDVAVVGATGEWNPAPALT